MGNNTCQQEHQRQLSDINMLMTEENVPSEQSDHNVQSKVTDRIYNVRFARNELIQRLRSIPHETLLYIVELILQLNKYSIDQLKTMSYGAHPTYQQMIEAILKFKHQPLEIVPCLCEQINELKLLYEIQLQPSQLLYTRPVYDEEYKLVREVTVKRYRNNLILKEDTITDVLITQKRIEHWLRISQQKCQNILQLRAGIIQNNKCKLLTNYIDGITLDKFIMNKLTYNDKQCISTQMIDAIRFIHSNQLIHGDIKLSNFMVSNSLVVLMDLDQLGSTGRTADMTYLYTLPEAQLPSYSGDIWALGLCIYQVFFGQKIEKDWFFEQYKERDYPTIRYEKVEPILQACLNRTPSDIWSISTLSKYL